MAEDYYSILGVPRDANPDQIKKAYRLLARKHHPDVSKEPGAAERFKRINEAYSALSDPAKRENYDRFGSAEGFAGGSPFGGGAGAGGNWSGGGNFGDVFDMFFGGESPFSFSFGGGGGAGAEGPRARDLQYPLELTLEEAFAGAEKKISLRRLDVCGECGGEGGFNPSGCRECGGTGQVRKTRRTVLGMFQTYGTCPSCKGRGETFSRQCPSCKGAGEKEAVHELTVKIPPGVDSGTTLRLAGEGELGGELYVLIDVAEHALFKRKGDDLLYPADVTFSQAALGGEISVPTLDGGDMKVGVPEGTQTGTTFRVPRKGMPSLRAPGRRGDLLVKMTVKTPVKLSQRDREILRELGAPPPAPPQKRFFGL